MSARPGRIWVVGAGAIGSLIAGHLARCADVGVLVRRREHAEALNAEGLRVTGKTDASVRVTAAVDASELSPPELIVIATKATQVEAACERIAGHAPGATVMTVQNGLGAESLVTQAGDWPVISGVTFMSGIRHGDTEVEYELDTPTWMGPYAPAPADRELVADVSRLFVEAGLRAEDFDDLLPVQWSKLIFNATVNTVAALTDLPHVGLFARREELSDLGHLVHDLADEGRRVARAVGVELHDDPWEMNVLAVRRGETDHGDYAHVPSMLADVRAGRPTEVDFISGALVRAAAEQGVEAPLHAAMYRLVRGRESSWADPSTWHA
jgi:2-dehydropantoate 2-reductase